MLEFLQKGIKMYRILAIAGSDCSGGAGVQADIKTITAHKMYAMSAITALTAQNTTGVFGIVEVEPNFIQAQIDACFEDIGVDSVKIGMLSNSDTINAITTCLKKWNAKNIVVDPVMVATSGAKLIKDDAISAIIDKLFKIANVVTPNLPEAQILSEMEIKNIDDMKKSALKIAKMTSGAVLIKGGHLQDNCNDVLLLDNEFIVFEGKRICTKNTHGTGCTLSSAIACGLAGQQNVRLAIENAKKFVFEAIKSNLKIGQANGPIDHCFNIKAIF